MMADSRSQKTNDHPTGVAPGVGPYTSPEFAITGQQPGLLCFPPSFPPESGCACLQIRTQRLTEGTLAS